jgi:hypothetical protein
MPLFVLAIAHAVLIIVRFKGVNLAKIRIALLAQEFQAAFEVVHFHQELALVKNGFLPGTEIEVIFVAHHDGFLGTNVLAESTVDATQHVDFKGLGITFLGVGGLGGLHADGKGRASPRTKATGHATLLASFLYQYRTTTELRAQLRPLLRIADGDLLPEHVLEGECHSLENLREVHLVYKVEIPFSLFSALDTHISVLGIN